jgi:hypothetical protein
VNKDSTPNTIVLFFSMEEIQQLVGDIDITKNIKTQLTLMTNNQNFLQLHQGDLSIFVCNIFDLVGILH